MKPEENTTELGAFLSCRFAFSAAIRKGLWTFGLKSSLWIKSAHLQFQDTDDSGNAASILQKTTPSEELGVWDCRLYPKGLKTFLLLLPSGRPTVETEHGRAEPVGRELRRKAGRSRAPVHIPLVVSGSWEQNTGPLFHVSQQATKLCSLYILSQFSCFLSAVLVQLQCKEWSTDLGTLMGGYSHPQVGVGNGG